MSTWEENNLKPGYAPSPKDSQHYELMALLWCAFDLLDADKDEYAVEAIKTFITTAKQYHVSTEAMQKLHTRKDQLKYELIYPEIDWKWSDNE